MRTPPLDITARSDAPPPALRAGGDRCPTAIKLHAGADGLIARIRVPGGRLAPEQALVLAGWARLPGDESADVAVDRIEITGRGNVQLRGLRTEQSGPLAAALHEAGLLPSEPHDQARTIVASPLAGRLAGSAPVDALVLAVDVALCTAPELAGLSGRFLTAVDDGTGLAGIDRADLAIQRFPMPSLSVATSERVMLFVGGTAAGTMPLEQVGTAFVAAARAFLTQASGSAWQVRELPDGGRAIIAGLQASGVVAAPPRVARAMAPSGLGALPPLGLGRQNDGRGFVRALAPLGRLTAAQLQAAAELAAAAGTELRVFGDRSLTLPDLAVRLVAPTADGLAAAGFLVADQDPGVGLTACAGLGCSSSRGDVRAAAALRLAARRPGAPREHLVGCDRRCGAPVGAADQQTFVLADGEQPPAFAARIAAAAAQETDR